ncbi:MAG: tagatose-6-phosphate kinase [Deltaproteobacteria bacterium]|nr:tagatose-6-phosphate kinase [Deltaproteobacteria bacterium]
MKIVSISVLNRALTQPQTPKYPGTPRRTFAQDVRARDPNGLILLGRDHGGPWQHPLELDRNYDEARALRSAIDSYREDIDNGFDLLHIDTGSSLHGEPSVEKAVERMVILYDWCIRYAALHEKEIGIEVGAEDQRNEAADPKSFAVTHDKIVQSLRAKGLPLPLFEVAQTGTKVVEDRNTGVFTQVSRQSQTARNVRGMVEIAGRDGVYIKAHNCDYLNDQELKAFAGLGVGGINVAPELGVFETRSLLRLLEARGLTEEKAAFVVLAQRSGKWKKWLSDGRRATSVECAVLGGHYVFATEECVRIKETLAHRMGRTVAELDQLLIGDLVGCIQRYWAKTKQPWQTLNGAA